jgi:hypothetical protein
MADDGPLTLEAKSKARMFARWFDAANITIIALGALVIVAAQIQMTLPGEFDKKRSESHMFFFDFSKYYVCGKLAGSPDKDNVYDPAVQARYLTEFGGADPGKPVEYIQYPPIDFPLMMPLATLPISQAFNWFYGIGLALALSGTWLVARESRYFNNKLSYICLWLAIFASVPLFRAYSLGQTSLFLLGLTAIYAFAFLRKRDWLAGIALALTAIKPQYSVYLAIPALATWRWPILISATIAELVLLAMAAATVGFKNIIDFPAVVMHADQASTYGGVFAEQMVNLRALFCLCTTQPNAMRLSSLAAGLVLLTLLWLWHRYRAANVEKRLIALTICLCVTTSPHTHLYDSLLMVVAVILTNASSLSAALAARYAAVFTASIEGEDQLAKLKLFWPERLLTILMLVYAPLSWLIFFCPIGKAQLNETALTLPFAVINVVICALQMACLRHEAADKTRLPGKSA